MLDMVLRDASASKKRLWSTYSNCDIVTCSRWDELMTIATAMMMTVMMIITLINITLEIKASGVTWRACKMWGSCCVSYALQLTQITATVHHSCWKRPALYWRFWLNLTEILVEISLWHMQNVQNVNIEGRVAQHPCYNQPTLQKLYNAIKAKCRRWS